MSTPDMATQVEAPGSTSTFFASTAIACFAYAAVALLLLHALRKLREPGALASLSPQGCRANYSRRARVCLPVRDPLPQRCALWHREPHLRSRAVPVVPLHFNSFACFGTGVKEWVYAAGKIRL